MNFIKHKIIPIISNRLNINLLLSLSKQYFLHPFYHTVSDDYLPHIHPLYKPKTVKEFQNDIDYLLKYFHPLSIHDVYLKIKNKNQDSKPYFHLSFDDGLREIYDTVLPFLYRKGIPATIFVNSGFVDNKDLFYRYKAALIMDKLDKGITKNKKKAILRILDRSEKSDIPDIKSELLKINRLNQNILDDIAEVMSLDFRSFLTGYKPYLSTGELKEMQSKGFTIGGHSVDHPHYSLLSEEEQINQTFESCDFVRKNFNEPVSYFAFPFSDAGIKDSLFSQIYEKVQLTFGISGIGYTQNSRHIARLDMEKYGKDAKESINKAYFIYILKKIR
ncbi:MAG: polysaccharide deacetylase family protein [Candidatus Azobacteroides sp.]|nr:polysaccharide deacetylase family protein [Candidatus Azobacteroides sp.]